LIKTTTGSAQCLDMRLFGVAVQKGFEPCQNSEKENAMNKSPAKWYTLNRSR